MEQHRDEHIVCAMCGTRFLFSAAEAAVYAERKLAAPKRCRECRRVRKEQRGRLDGAPRGQRAHRADGYGVPPRTPRYTGDVNEYRSPMPDTYAGPPWAGQPPPMRPRRAHVAKDDGIYRAPSFGGDRRGPRRGGPPAHPEQHGAADPETRTPRSRPMFSITCKSCGAEGEVPFKPIDGRDVFCKACYRARKSA